MATDVKDLTSTSKQQDLDLLRQMVEAGDRKYLANWRHIKESEVNPAIAEKASFTEIKTFLDTLNVADGAFIDKYVYYTGTDNGADPTIKMYHYDADKMVRQINQADPIGRPEWVTDDNAGQPHSLDNALWSGKNLFQAFENLRSHVVPITTSVDIDALMAGKALDYFVLLVPTNLTTLTHAAPLVVANVTYNSGQIVLPPERGMVLYKDTVTTYKATYIDFATLSRNELTIANNVTTAFGDLLIPVKATATGLKLRFNSVGNGMALVRNTGTENITIQVGSGVAMDANLSAPDILLKKNSTVCVYAREGVGGSFVLGSQEGLRGKPVADLAALKALDAREFEERLVKANGSVYVFKLTADLTAGEDADANNIADDAGTGKWILKLKDHVLTDAEIQDPTNVSIGSISGGKALFDREQALKGSVADIVMGTEQIARPYDAKTLFGAIKQVISAYKFWEPSIASYGDGSVTINRPDQRIVVDPANLKLYKAVVDTIPAGHQPKDYPAEWELVKTSGEERNISVTKDTLAATITTTLPTSETVGIFLKHPLVAGEQPRVLTTRIVTDMALADVKTALNTSGPIELRDGTGTIATDPTAIPKGFYQISNKSTTGESWLFDDITGSAGSKGEYFDGGYIGQVNYSSGWSQLSLSSGDSSMGGFALSGNVVTCLVTGRYSVYASLSMGDVANGQLGSGDSRLQIIIRKNGDNTKAEAWTKISSSNWPAQVATSGVVDLVAGDTVDVAVGAYGQSAYTRASKVVIIPVANQVVEKTTPIITAYSTGEQDTGMIWMDGKPIYQKSYNEAISNGGAELSLGSGISTLVKIEGSIMNASRSIQKPISIGADNDGTITAYYNSGSVIITNTWSSNGATHFEGTIWYTKQ